MSDCLVTDPVEGGPTLAAQVLANDGPWDTVMCAEGASHLPEWRAVIGTDPSRWRQLLERRRRRVDRIVLMPDGGFSYAVLLRLWLIRILMPKASVRLYILQLFREPTFLRPLARRLTVVALNEDDAARFRRLRVPTEVLPVPLPLDRISNMPRSEARAAVGLPATGQVFLHVGHATEGRNLHALAPLAQDGLLVLVMSPFSPLDPATLPTGPNVVVVHERVDVRAYYRAADAYVFPTVAKDAVIGIPMSIAEARGNEIPVVARRSSLTERWSEDPGVALVDSDEELVRRALLTVPTPAT